MAIQSIAIIGAGISGLVTANAMLKKGYTVTVFEKKGSIGESWGRSIFFIGEVVQTIRKDYTFYGADMPPAIRKMARPEQLFDAALYVPGLSRIVIAVSTPTLRSGSREIISIPCFMTGSIGTSIAILLLPAPEVLDFVGLHGGHYFTLTATIAAHWMTAYLSGAIASPAHLPQGNRPKRYNNKKQLSQLIHYLNLLLKDMGGKPRVSSNAFLCLLGTRFKPEAYIQT
jgi:hypothetical protein